MDPERCGPLFDCFLVLLRLHEHLKPEGILLWQLELTMWFHMTWTNYMEIITVGPACGPSWIWRLGWTSNFFKEDALNRCLRGAFDDKASLEEASAWANGKTLLSYLALIIWMSSVGLHQDPILLQFWARYWGYGQWSSSCYLCLMINLHGLQRAWVILENL